MLVFLNDAFRTPPTQQAALRRDILPAAGGSFSFFQIAPLKGIRMTEKLDPEAKRLRHVSSGELADAIGALEARVEVLKAPRSAPISRCCCGCSGSPRAEYASRFCHPVHTGWRLTCTAPRKVAAAARGRRPR